MNNEYESGRYGTNIKYFEDEPDYTSYYNNDSSIKATPNVAYIEDSELVVYDWNYAPEDWDPDEIVLTEETNPTIYNILNDANIEHEDPDGYTIGELQAITLEDLVKPDGSGNWDGTGPFPHGTANSIFWSYNYADGIDWNDETDPGSSDWWSFDEFKYFTGITEIPNLFFSNCHGMTSITIPRSVTKIDYYAFHDCWWLESITIEYSPQTLYIVDTDYDLQLYEGYEGYQWDSAFIYTGKWLDPNWDESEKEDTFYRDVAPELGYTSSLDRLQKVMVDGEPILNTNNRPIVRAYMFDQNGIPITDENLETYIQSNNGE